MAKRTLFMFISLISVIIILIVIILGITTWGWFPSNGNAYATYDRNLSIDSHDFDSTTDTQSELELEKDRLSDISEELTSDKDKLAEQKEKESIKSSDEKSQSQKKTRLSMINEHEKKKKGIVVNRDYKKSSYSKYNSAYTTQHFDARGEYVPYDEYQYRVSLVKNLTIKSVIIDKLSIGNGISQEFFKVVYKSKMIPAKILQDIVESREFRDLIPTKYLNKESGIAKLKNGEYIEFSNVDIRNLLIKWTKGNLTPIKKAWEVGAE